LSIRLRLSSPNPYFLNLTISRFLSIVSNARLPFYFIEPRGFWDVSLGEELGVVFSFVLVGESPVSVPEYEVAFSSLAWGCLELLLRLICS